MVRAVLWEFYLKRGLSDSIFFFFFWRRRGIIEPLDTSFDINMRELIRWDMRPCHVGGCDADFGSRKLGGLLRIWIIRDSIRMCPYLSVHSETRHWKVRDFNYSRVINFNPSRSWVVLDRPFHFVPFLSLSAHKTYSFALKLSLIEICQYKRVSDITYIQEQLFKMSHRAWTNWNNTSNSNTKCR